MGTIPTDLDSGVKESNAIVDSVSLKVERGGILTAYLHLRYNEAGCQSFGGRALYLSDSFEHHGGQANYAGHFLFRCMEICGVEDWEKMKGKTVRAIYEHSKVHGIGHIIEDDWFFPDKEFDELKSLEGTDAN